MAASYASPVGTPSRRLGFDDVVKAVATVKGEAWELFVNRHGDWGRDLAFLVARSVMELTLRELGEAAGGMELRGCGGSGAAILTPAGEVPCLRTAYRRLLNILNVET